MKADLYSELFGLIAMLDDRNPDATIGDSSPIDREPLQFSNDASLSFHGAPATHVDDRSDQTVVYTGIFGLLGPIGSLPHIYSEMSARAARANETATRDFFDIFSHRSTSLMYRAWRKNRSSLENQPGATPERQRKFSAMLEGFTGSSDLPERIAWLDFERDRVLSCADVFTRRVRSADGLRRLLNRQFGMDFDVEEFVGNWESLPDEAKSSFGPAGNNPRLGYNTIVGNRTWQVQSTFRVVIRHPAPSQYGELQPGSESLRLMQLVVRMYCPPELSFRLHIVVRGSAIEPGELGASDGGSGAMLGWNTVLGGPDKDRDYAFSICRDYNESRMTT